jgi:hypothetical protein
MGLRLALVLIAIALPLAAQSEIGAPLPAWSQGILDIHQISTGRGNAAFFRFPDGTTLLVDAGAAANGMELAYSEPRPNATRTPGAWIVQYIARAMSPELPRLDYALLTHFHPDHMGAVTTASAPSKSGAFKLTGITEVGERIPIGTLIDRGSSYQTPPDDAMWKNYRAFVVEQEKSRAMKYETIRVGRADQIVLRHDAAAFPTFEVRSVAANGVVWSGKGDETVAIFPPLESIGLAEDRPTENMCSIGLRIRYGRFDYFTGGDMPGIPDAGAPEWHSVETPIARAIGATDVHVVNHHGSISPASAFFLSTLRSPVMILPAWSPTHPSQDSLKRMLTQRLYPGPHDVFAVTLREPTKASIGARVDQMKATHGHIVVRVPPGGDQFKVYVLDDTTESANVVAVFGPYASK